MQNKLIGKIRLRYDTASFGISRSCNFEVFQVFGHDLITTGLVHRNFTYEVDTYLKQAIAPLLKGMLVTLSSIKNLR